MRRRVPLLLVALLVAGCGGSSARAPRPADEHAEASDAVAGQVQQDQQRWTQREVEQAHADVAKGR
jgi:hypothetical protein